MQGKKSNIKVKVIGWFLLAALAVILTGIISYTSYRELLTALENPATQETKLKVLGSILANITAAEAKIRTYALTREPAILEEYQQQVQSISADLVRVKLIEPVDQSFNLQVDSISLLLDEQTKDVSGFIELKKTLSELSFSSQALEEIHNSTDSIEALRTTTTTTTTTKSIGPLVPEIEDSKGKNTKRQQRKRAQEIAKELMKLEQEPSIQRETVVTTDTSYVKQDTLMKSIEQILTEISSEESRYQHVMADKELRLIESSMLIIEQMRGLIGSLEKQEFALNLQRANNAKLIASRSTLTISIIIFLCLILGILFTYLIFKDVRIGDFYNKQLIGQKNQAQQLADSKQQFLATMSHEIRTPLNAIIGFTGQLTKTPLQPDQRQFVDAVQSSGQQLLDTVNDILDYSKLEAGEIKVVKEPFELKRSIQEVIKVLKFTANEKGIQLLVEISEDPVWVVGDQFRLKQVLYNLLSNGIKFTDKGFVKLTYNSDASNNQLAIKLTVEDTGIGIPKDKQQVIFGDFKQVDSAINRNYQGTGLGLAICKKLLELQEGTITVQSDGSTGTKFIVDIVYEMGQEVREQRFSTGSEEQTSKRDLNGTKLLVADDDPFNIQLLKSILDKWQAEAVYCDNGEQALEILEQQNFDIILTDINMPIVSGVELTRQVRSFDDENKRNIPILALTANVMENDLEAYKQAGIDEFVLKPFVEDELYQKIYNNLNVTPNYSLEDLKQFSGGDMTAFKPMLETFYQNLDQNMKDLQLSADNKDLNKVGEVAHKLISSFGHIRSIEAVGKLRKLENSIKVNNQSVSIPDLVGEINEIYQPVAKGLQEELSAMA